jgi:hypothetical protein
VSKYRVITRFVIYHITLVINRKTPFYNKHILLTIYTVHAWMQKKVTTREEIYSGE